MIVGCGTGDLAQAQADKFTRRLEAYCPEVEVERREIGKDLLKAVADGTVDAAVLSMTHIPIDLDPALAIGAVMKRGAVEEALYPIPWEALKCGAIVGTSSMRRLMLFRTRKPGVRIKEISGSIEERMKKFDTEEYNSILFSKADLDLLDITKLVHTIDKHTIIPAPGQGAIGVVCRAGDSATLEILRNVNNRDSNTEVTIERGIMKAVGATIKDPVAVNAEVEDGLVSIIASSFLPDVPVHVQMTFPETKAEEKIKEIGDRLMRKA